MNFITLKELKKMVPVASEFKRVPGLKKILEDGIEVILRKRQHNSEFFGIGCRIFYAAIEQRRAAHSTGNLAAGHLCPEKYSKVYTE